MANTACVYYEITNKNAITLVHYLAQTKTVIAINHVYISHYA